MAEFPEIISNAGSYERTVDLCLKIGSINLKVNEICASDDSYKLWQKNLVKNDEQGNLKILSSGRTKFTMQL